MKKIFLYTLFFSIILSSCNKEITDQKAEEVKKENKVLEQIQGLGFSLDDIIEYEDRYVVEGDIVFFKDSTQSYSDVGLRQAYDTNIAHNQFQVTIYVLNNFSNIPVSQATDDVIKAYNAIGSRLKFSRTNNMYSADIIITREDKLGQDICGLAGFPKSNGKVFNYVWISERQLASSNYTSLSKLTFLIAHEIGHCIGLRHTDWQRNGETGGINIPGTSDKDLSSVMYSHTCGLNWKGFAPNDKMAILKLYPPVTPIYRYYLYPGGTGGVGAHVYSRFAPNSSNGYYFNGVFFPFEFHDLSIPTQSSGSVKPLYLLYSSSLRRYKVGTSTNTDPRFDKIQENLGYIYINQEPGTVPLKEYYVANNNDWVYICLERELAWGEIHTPGQSQYLRTLGYVYLGSRTK